MKKLFASLTLAVAFCLSACAAQPTEPVNTPVPTAPEETVAPTPTLTPSPSQFPILSEEQNSATSLTPQHGSDSVKCIETTVNVYYCYNRLFDTNGNWVNSGHCFYSICGNCGSGGCWFDNKCEHCGAIYTDRTEEELFYTRICDPNDTSIIYSESREPFIVR